MAFYTGTFTPPINAYHRNNSLLLQFILFEFIEAYTECQRLAELCHIKPSPLPVANDWTQHASTTQKQIHSALTRLAGSSTGKERLISWSCESGLLSKLKTYCSLFSQNNDKDEKELLGMQHYMDKAWQQGLQAKAFFNTPKESHSQFLSSLEKMNQSMQRFAKHIVRLLTLFRDDENLVLFLLRHRSQLEKIYSPRSIAKILSKMHPKGLREIKQLLKMKYSKRGFSNISASIDAHISELEAAPL